MNIYKRHRFPSEIIQHAEVNNLLSIHIGKIEDVIFLNNIANRHGAQTFCSLKAKPQLIKIQYAIMAMTGFTGVKACHLAYFPVKKLEFAFLFFFTELQVIGLKLACCFSIAFIYHCN